MKKAMKRFLSTVLVFLFVFEMLVIAIPARKVYASTSYSVTVTGSTVNVRSGAGTNYSKIGSAKKGATYDYLGQKTVSGVVWYKIQYSSSKTGWISGSYSKKTAKTSSSSTATDTSMNSYIKSVAKSYGADGIQVAIIENGVVTETFNYGYATKKSKAMTSDTKIRVASLSKVAVVMMAEKMQEQGIVDLGASISTYVGSTYKKNTLSNIFSHTSTLRSLSSPANAAKLRSQLKSSSSYRGGTAGSSSLWSYNNYAFGIAGSVLEIAANTTLNKYGDEYFFNSLGADISWASGRVDTSKLATLYYAGGKVARSVTKQKGIKGSNTPGSNATFFAGGLTSSAKDYAKLFAILANDGTYDGVRYLEESSVEQMEKKLFKKTENGGTFYQCRPLRYKANLYGESELYYHTGNAYGVLALASYNPETRNGVVVVTTGASAGRDSQGVYSVCSKITKYAYSYINKKNTTTTESTTASTTEATTVTSVESTEATEATTVTSAESTETTEATTATSAETTETTEATTVTSAESTETTEATTATSAETTETTEATTVTSAETTETTASTTVTSAESTSTTASTTVTTTASTNASTKRVRITGSSVNVRKGAGTKYAIITAVKKNKVYTYTATKKVGGVTWYKIKISSTVSGWICGTYAKKA